MYYFASDIHLGAGDAATARAVERRFVAWLDDAARDAEAIFLVGDIFDFWSPRALCGRWASWPN